MHQRTELERMDRALKIVSTDFMLALLCIDMLLQEKDGMGTAIERSPEIFARLEERREFIRQQRDQETENAYLFGQSCQSVYESSFNRADETFNLEDLENLYHAADHD